MTKRTSPTGHVPLLDRRPLLSASRGSCNKNIQSQLYTSTCTHIHSYPTLYIYIYMHYHIQPNRYITHPYVNNRIPMYACMHIHQCIPIINVRIYDTATFLCLGPREKHICLYPISIYCTCLVPQIIEKYQTHLQNVLLILV